MLNKAQEDIVNKLETRGVMPTQLTMQPNNKNNNNYKGNDNKNDDKNNIPNKK